MKYLNNIKSLDDLKKKFCDLARKNHPDVGGDPEVMREINVEYDALFAIWKNRKETETGEKVNESADSTRTEFYTCNGWEGSKHSWNRTTQEVAAIIRAYVKEKYPTYKFSVRCHFASMCSDISISLKEAPERIYKAFDDLTSDDISDVMRHIRFNSNYDSLSTDDIRKAYDDPDNSHIKIYTDIVKAMIDDVDNEVKSYNYEDCDGQIDYFNVDFYYFGVKIDRDFKVVTKAARIIKKADTSETAGTDSSKYTVEKSKHTKTGADIWLVKWVDSLSRSQYLDLSQQIKRMGGYYSKFTHSFIFNYDPINDLKAVTV